MTSHPLPPFPSPSRRRRFPRQNVPSQLYPVDLTFVLLCSGRGSDARTYRPKLEETQWWGRRDALVRCASAALWGLGGVVGGVGSSGCVHGGNGVEYRRGYDAAHPTKTEVILLFDGDLSAIRMTSPPLGGHGLAKPTTTTMTMTANACDGASDVGPTHVSSFAAPLSNAAAETSKYSSTKSPSLSLKIPTERNLISAWRAAASRPIVAATAEAGADAASGSGVGSIDESSASLPFLRKGGGSQAKVGVGRKGRGRGRPGGSVHFGPIEGAAAAASSYFLSDPNPLPFSGVTCLVAPWPTTTLEGWPGARLKAARIQRTPSRGRNCDDRNGGGDHGSHERHNILVGADRRPRGATLRSPVIALPESKREAIRLLQSTCSMEFLRENRLNSGVDVLMRRTSRGKLGKIWDEWVNGLVEGRRRANDDDDEMGDGSDALKGGDGVGTSVEKLGGSRRDRDGGRTETDGDRGGTKRKRPVGDGCGSEVGAQFHGMLEDAFRSMLEGRLGNRNGGGWGTSSRSARKAGKDEGSTEESEEGEEEVVAAYLHESCGSELPCFFPLNAADAEKSDDDDRETHDDDSEIGCDDDNSVAKKGRGRTQNDQIDDRDEGGRRRNKPTRERVERVRKSSSRRRMRLCLFLGAVRDMKESELAALRSACASARVGSSRSVSSFAHGQKEGNEVGVGGECETGDGWDVPLLAFRIGPVPEFTSKIIAVVGYHNFRGRLGPAVRRAMQPKNGPSPAPCIGGEDEILFSGGGEANDGKSLRQCCNPSRCRRIHFLCPLPVLSMALTSDANRWPFLLWRLVRITVCALWRSRLASSSSVSPSFCSSSSFAQKKKWKRKGKGRADGDEKEMAAASSSNLETEPPFPPPLENSLTILFADNVVVTLEQGELVKAMASEHRAAPSEYQVLEALRAKLDEAAAATNGRSSVVKVGRSMDTGGSDDGDGDGGAGQTGEETEDSVKRWRRRRRQVVRSILCPFKGGGEVSSSEGAAATDAGASKAGSVPNVFGLWVDEGDNGSHVRENAGTSLVDIAYDADLSDGTALDLGADGGLCLVILPVRDGSTSAVANVSLEWHCSKLVEDIRDNGVPVIRDFSLFGPGADVATSALAPDREASAITVLQHLDYQGRLLPALVRMNTRKLDASNSQESAILDIARLTAKKKKKKKKAKRQNNKKVW